MTGIRADANALPNLAKQLETLRSEGLARITKATAQEAIRQIVQGFRESRDPYGKPWEPLTSRTGQPLRKTGRLQNSFAAVVRSDTTFSVGTNTMYAATHQYGAVIKPVRAKVLAFKVDVKRYGG